MERIRLAAALKAIRSTETSYRAWYLEDILGLPCSTVAVRVGLPLNTVTSHVRRARLRGQAACRAWSQSKSN